VFVLVGKPTDESGFGGAAFASVSWGRGPTRRRAAARPVPEARAERGHVRGVPPHRERGIACGFKDLGAGGDRLRHQRAGRGRRMRRADRLCRSRTVSSASCAPEVLLCAETQERYCWVVPESFAAELCDIYEREFALGGVHHGAGARVIGRAMPERRYTVRWHDDVLVDCDVEAITTGRRVERPAVKRVRSRPTRGRRRAPDPQKALLALLSGLHVGSRHYLTAHYDGDVQGRTWLRAGEGDASVLRVHPERPLGVAFAVAGNPFWCDGDPALGAAHAVAEAARNVALTGARPWALTDCLNFGHPEDAEVMGDLEETLAGLSEAARALGGLASPGYALPFVSGNVSLYNQVGRQAIPPSPIVMCAGVIHDVSRALGLGVRGAGHVLVLVGEDRDGLEGSTYRREILRERGGPPPALDLARELSCRTSRSRWPRAAGRWRHTTCPMAASPWR
jgi:phosphoribosylformylglycinamidine synthase